ncbi:MAG: hypothetical protein ACYTBJ_00485 [Planctomycetota bacterium]|jgi:hypothetical protein
MAESNDKALTACTVNLDLEDSTGLVAKILDALTDNDRRDVARNLVQSWASEPVSAERQAKEREVLDDFMKKKHYDATPYYRTESEARDSRDFRLAMEEFKSTRERMVEEIQSALYKAVERQVLEVIQDDTQLQELIRVAKEEMVFAIPGMISKSLVDRFWREMWHTPYKAEFEDHIDVIQKIKKRVDLG